MIEENNDNEENVTPTKIAYSYYYANGQKIYLEKSEQYCAISSDELNDLMASYKSLEKSTDAIVAQAKSMNIVDRNRVEGKNWALLFESNRIQPVYQHDDALIVIFPEVRIEETREIKKLELSKYLDRIKNLIQKENIRDRTTINIKSGIGIDALNIANELHESIEPEMVQARMLRVLKKPN